MCYMNFCVKPQKSDGMRSFFFILFIESSLRSTCVFVFLKCVAFHLTKKNINNTITKILLKCSVFEYIQNIEKLFHKLSEICLKQSLSLCTYNKLAERKTSQFFYSSFFFLFKFGQKEYLHVYLGHKVNSEFSFSR